jgi:hypothetical protein
MPRYIVEFVKGDRKVVEADSCLSSSSAFKFYREARGQSTIIAEFPTDQVRGYWEEGVVVDEEDS